MKSSLYLIASVLFLSAGLGLIFGYCHGTAGLLTAIPLSSSSVQVNITTTGIPALGGFALTVMGLVLLIVALIAAVLGLFQSKEDASISSVDSPRESDKSSL